MILVIGSGSGQLLNPSRSHLSPKQVHASELVKWSETKKKCISMNHIRPSGVKFHIEIPVKRLQKSENIQFGVLEMKFLVLL